MIKKTIIFIVSAFLFLSCGNTQEHNKELLVYCGATMAKPMNELAKQLEKKYSCKIHIIKGPSGYLYQSILTNKIGDLYLPGSVSYIRKAMNDNLISDTVNVGLNRMVIMTRKGFSKSLKERKHSCFLLDDKLRVVIANPYSSIGKATKKVLQEESLYEKVVSKIPFFAIDSQDLVKILKNDKADLVVNWYAPYTWDSNKDFIDIIPLDSLPQTDNVIVLSTLTYSKHPQLAQLLLNYVGSDEGKKVFRKYGL